MTRFTRHSFIVAFAAVALPAALFGQAQSAQQLTVSGNSHPSVEAKLNLHESNVILKLPVEEGQVVKKGDLLLQQDDRQDQALQEAYKLEADSSAKVEAAVADLKIKQIDLERKKTLLTKGSATQTEVEDAEVKVVYADSTVKVQQLEQDIAKLKVKQQAVKLDQMKLLSPIDGVVAAIGVSEGEVTDPQKPVMTVVKLDPLWIEFYLPTNQSLKLKVGQQLQVRYADDQQWQNAKLIFRAPVADVGSFQQEIRLELANPQLKDAGLEMQVKLPAELGPIQPAAPAAALLPQSR